MEFLQFKSDVIIEVKHPISMTLIYIPIYSIFHVNDTSLGFLIQIFVACSSHIGVKL